MEKGDLELWEQPTIIIVIEGVLCDMEPVTESRRFRSEKILGYTCHWYDLAMKRTRVNKDRWPNVSHEYVTFESEMFLDSVTSYLDAARMPYDVLSYQPFDLFVDVLKYRPEVQGVYDSDPDRLDRYGQRGIAVYKGTDY